MEEDIALPLKDKNPSSMHEQESRVSPNGSTKNDLALEKKTDEEVIEEDGDKESKKATTEIRGDHINFVKNVDDLEQNMSDKRENSEEKKAQQFDLEVNIENSWKESNKDSKTLSTQPNTPNTRETRTSLSSTSSPDSTLRSVTTKLEETERGRTGIYIETEKGKEKNKTLDRKQDALKDSLQRFEGKAEENRNMGLFEENGIQNMEKEDKSLIDEGLTKQGYSENEEIKENLKAGDKNMLASNAYLQMEKDSLDESVEVILPKRITTGKDSKSTNLNSSSPKVKADLVLPSSSYGYKIKEPMQISGVIPRALPESFRAEKPSEFNNDNFNQKKFREDESLLTSLSNAKLSSHDKLSSFSSPTKNDTTPSSASQNDFTSRNMNPPTIVASLRRGKWTYEEEAYVMKMIEFFQDGLLPIAPGATLRSYLSEKLHCDPMRITKKFTGPHCIGKRVFHPYDPALRSPEEVAEKLKELDLLERKWYTKIFAQDREIEFRNYLLHTKPHLSLEKCNASTTSGHNSSTNKTNNSDPYTNSNPLNSKQGTNRSRNKSFTRNSSTGGNVNGNLTPMWNYPHSHPSTHPHQLPHVHTQHSHPMTYVNHPPNTYNFPLSSGLPTTSPIANQNQKNNSYIPSYHYVNSRHQGYQSHAPRHYTNQAVDIQRLRSTSVSSVVSNVSNSSSKAPNSGQLKQIPSNSSLNGLNASFTAASSNFQNKGIPQLHLPPSPNIQGIKYGGAPPYQHNALSQQRSLSYQELQYPPTRNNSFISLQGNLDQSTNGSQTGRKDSVGSFSSIQHQHGIATRPPIMVSSPMMGPHPPAKYQVSTVSTNMVHMKHDGPMPMQNSNPSVSTNRPPCSNASPQYHPIPPILSERQSLMLPGSKPPGLPFTPHPQAGACHQSSVIVQQKTLSGESKHSCSNAGMGQTTAKRKSSETFVDNEQNGGREDAAKRAKTALDSTAGPKGPKDNIKDTCEQKV